VAEYLLLITSVVLRVSSNNNNLRLVLIKMTFLVSSELIICMFTATHLIQFYETA